MSQSVGPDRSVRPAQSGDARAIARLQREAWRSLMGQDALDAQGITEEVLAAQWEATLASPRPGGTALLVALHGNTIVGFALAGPDEAGVPTRASPGLVRSGDNDGQCPGQLRIVVSAATEYRSHTRPPTRTAPSRMITDQGRATT